MCTKGTNRNLGDPVLPRISGRRSQGLNKARQSEELQGVGFCHSTDEASNDRGWKGMNTKHKKTILQGNTFCKQRQVRN